MRPGGDERQYEAKAERLEGNAAAVMASQGRRPGTTVDWECAGDQTTPRHTTPHSAVDDRKVPYAGSTRAHRHRGEEKQGEGVLFPKIRI